MDPRPDAEDPEGVVVAPDPDAAAPERSVPPAPRSARAKAAPRAAAPLSAGASKKPTTPKAAASASSSTRSSTAKRTAPKPPASKAKAAPKSAAPKAAAPQSAAPRRTASAPKPASLAAALQYPSTVVDREGASRPAEAEVPATEAPEVEGLEAAAPEPEAPEVEASEPEALETEAPETEGLEAAAPEAEATADTEPPAEAATRPTAKPAARSAATTRKAPRPPRTRRATTAPVVEADAPPAESQPVASEAPARSQPPAAALVEPAEADTPAPAAADRPAEADQPADTPLATRTVLSVQGLTKRFDGTVAVDGIDIQVSVGSIFGIVGPNGAGKTTTLSMVTGLLRPDAGTVHVHGADVWKDPVAAKRNMGVLPDRLRLFDRLTGAQLLYYSGTLRGLDRHTVKSRTADLAAAFGLEEALGRLVTDYSAGMTKKIALAAAMIHSPRLLILDEPFEAVDPVSAANVIEILQKYAAAGGTVVMSSHSMDLIQRICDAVSIIVRGSVLASGTMDEVRAGSTLEDRFVDLAGGRKAAEGMEWLHSFSG